MLDPNHYYFHISISYEKIFKQITSKHHLLVDKFGYNTSLEDELKFYHIS
jgi:hypothetical protein